MASITYQRNGAVRTLPVGFSFTTFFFGFIPSLVRGQWSFMWLMVLSDLVGCYITAWVFLGQDALASVVVLRFIMAFIRNKAISEAYVRDGWRAQNVATTTEIPASNDEVH